ncbi:MULTISPECIES: PAS domain-containing sensor histidine kinase [unclassified Paludibacterium]|uniref:sensor histidine kinase n=1 Tax=unclassified Paludibacterium TaxID=2618429 RepID=UPI001C055300|nr:HAMP domain-containing sensor histidine kinase [Paludibacterium sp. B53371]BEV71900.1 sensor histidine kinase FleS [Paludibacterium sp. THUN1379]
MPKNVSKLPDQQQLEAAFEQFNAVSDQLIGAYSQLESQVNVLNQQLDEANNALRRQVEANAELAERLGMLLEALPAGVIELSEDGRVISENPTAIQMLGRHILGENWQDILPLLQPTELDQSYRLASGCHLTLQYKDLPASGGRIALLHDVTRLNQLSGELARQEKLAAMGSMAASLAHQLRTPLSTALLYAANLKKTDLKEEDRNRFIDKILTRLKALEGLIQNMLGFVRGQVTEREPLDMALVLDDLNAVFLPQCQSRGINFVCASVPASAITVMGDRKALVGAMTNLLENAVFFSPQGSTIELNLTQTADSLCLQVCDAGPGIPQAEQERLFEPFYTTRSGGTGLGLAIVKKVAEELGGRVSCSNRPQGGAAFEFCLPVARQ